MTNTNCYCELFDSYLKLWPPLHKSCKHTICLHLRGFFCQDYVPFATPVSATIEQLHISLLQQPTPQVKPLHWGLWATVNKLIQKRSKHLISFKRFACIMPIHSHSCGPVDISNFRLYLGEQDLLRSSNGKLNLCCTTSSQQQVQFQAITFQCLYVSYSHWEFTGTTTSLMKSCLHKCSWNCITCIVLAKKFAVLKQAERLSL